MKCLLSNCCLVMIALVLLAGATHSEALRAVGADGKKVSLPHTLKMGKKAPVFTKTKDGSHGTRAGLGWKDAGKAIPMSGGTLTAGGFFVELTVGTGGANGQGIKFNPIVDTGSSNTNVPGVGCVNPACGIQFNPYNASASPTAKPLACSSPMCQNCVPTAVGSGAVPDQQGGTRAETCQYGTGPVCSGQQCAFQISYGGSGTSTQGVTVQDRACIGEICSDNVYLGSFTNQVPAGTQNDGIVGLAFPHNSCTPNCQPTILDMFVDQGVLKPEENTFGMCLTQGSGGFIDLGALNASRYETGTMQYTKVTKEHWYNIEVKDMKVAGTSIGVPSFLYNIVNDGIGAFADSGTTVVLVSPVAFQYLSSYMTSNFANLKGVNTLFQQQQCATGLSSSDVASYPEMSFVIAGMNGAADFEVKMNGQQYLLNEGGEYCLGIAGVPSIGAILGDVIMQNYYIHFDRVGSRLGFAPLKSGQC